MLDLIEGEPGGIHAYLRSIGVTDEELRLFRAVFVVP